jgi:hypothetical protein
MDASERGERTDIKGEPQGAPDTVHLKKLLPGEGG